MRYKFTDVITVTRVGAGVRRGADGYGWVEGRPGDSSLARRLAGCYLVRQVGGHEIEQKLCEDDVRVDDEGSVRVYTRHAHEYAPGSVLLILDRAVELGIVDGLCQEACEPWPGDMLELPAVLPLPSGTDDADSCPVLEQVRTVSATLARLMGLVA